MSSSHLWRSLLCVHFPFLDIHLSHFSIHFSHFSIHFSHFSIHHYYLFLHILHFSHFSITTSTFIYTLSINNYLLFPFPKKTFTIITSYAPFNFINYRVHVQSGHVFRNGGSTKRDIRNDTCHFLVQFFPAKSLLPKIYLIYLCI